MGWWRIMAQDNTITRLLFSLVKGGGGAIEDCRL